ncbi:MAG: MFS transporter [Protaetiibacter sp.]
MSNDAVAPAPGATPAPRSALDEPTRSPGLAWIAAVCLLNAGMMVALYTPIQVLLAQQSEAIAPDGKEILLALTTASGALSATVLNPVWGTLSDRTTARRGRRWPWILGGMITAVGALLLLSTAASVPMLILGWVLVQAAVNAMLAPIVAAIPDLVPTGQRGLSGGLIAVSQTVGVAVAAGVPFLTDSVQLAYLVAAAALVLLSIPYLVRSLDVPLRVGEFAAARAARPAPHERSAAEALVRSDFRWAFVTRFLMMFGNALMLLFLFYFLQDGLGLGREAAEGGVFMLTAIYAGTTVVTAAAGGALSDRVGRRKPFVIGSGIVVALAFGIIVVGNSFEATLVAAIVLGLGFGMYQAVDFALITQVLPEAGERGRDMGVLNIAAGLPQFVAPLVSIAVISGFGVNYSLIFGLGGVVSLLGAVLVVRIRGVA